MADYARPGGQARWMRGMSEQMRRQRTQRPRRGGVPSLTWQMEGEISLSRVFMPALITLDPLSDGDYPEHKQIIGFDGWVQGSDVLINWKHNTGYILEGFAVSGSSNRFYLDEPFIIENGDVEGEFIQPEIAEEPAFPATNLAVMAIVERVPV